MCVHIYIYIYSQGESPVVAPTDSTCYAQSPYYHRGFQRVRLKHNLNLKGWNSQANRGFPGKFESSNVSREIGRTATDR